MGKLRRVVAWLIRVFRRRRPEQSQDSEEQPRSDAKKIRPLTVAELEEAERKIIRRVQEESFPEDLERMKKGSLARLKPFREDGLLRLGGRLNRSSLDHDSKHPFILPKDNTVSELIILHYHGLNGHIGSHQTLAKTRERSGLQMEYLMLNGFSRSVRSVGERTQRLESKKRRNGWKRNPILVSEI